MVTNFTIYNSANSAGGRRQETLRKLAKEVITGSTQKERDVKQVIENREAFVTTQYISPETVIYNLSAQACLNDKLKVSLNFLNNKAAVKNLNTAPMHIYNEEELSENELFAMAFDETKNIFAA